MKPPVTFTTGPASLPTTAPFPGNRWTRWKSGPVSHVSQDEVDKKEDPLDFALWKAAKPGEIKWDSPWGAGAAWLAHRMFGDVNPSTWRRRLISTPGGRIWPFHTTKMKSPRSSRSRGQPFVRYWMHNGFVTIGKDNEKMSKSLHNFVTVHDLLQTVDPQVLRFFMATTQYRRPIQYSEEKAPGCGQ